MAKTKKRNRTHHPVITVLTILIMAGALVVAAKIFFDQNSPAEDPQGQMGSFIDPSATLPNKTEEESAKSAPASVESDAQRVIQNEGDDPNASESLTGAITTSEVIDQIFILRINIDQYLSTGTCSLTMTKNGQTVSKSTEIFATASTSSCQGFDIPFSELSAGLWNINIQLQSGDRTGVISGKANL